MQGSYNNQLTFNPGPSQLSPNVIRDIQQLAISGFLSISARTDAFKEVNKSAIEGFREKMSLPSDYHIFYQPSATATMDAILRNCVMRKSFHFVHGVFSELFYEIACEQRLLAIAQKCSWDQPIPFESVKIPSDCELIAVVHSESSTGLIWPHAALQTLRKLYPDILIAIDATSSLGGMSLPWESADLWFASVQKCLGLPSGLALLIVSPCALSKAQQLLKKKGVATSQNFISLAENMKTYETPDTPNMFNIALLAEQMKRWNLVEIESELMQKAKLLYAAKLPWTPYVVAAEWRSPTVLNFIVTSNERWYEVAKAGGMVLGKGYGPLKSSCVRIGNFPAISSVHVKQLLDWLFKMADYL